jgi:small-conductance mechanosensitive channel
VEKVRKAIKKKVYKPILANEELAPKLLAPIKSQGVRQLEDSAMIMRVKFKTAPGDQFEIRKEVFRLMQEAFKEEGIEFAHRNVTVYLPQETTEDETKNADTQDKIKQAAAAAALTAKQDTTQKKSSEDR